MNRNICDACKQNDDSGESMCDSCDGYDRFCASETDEVDELRSKIQQMQEQQQNLVKEIRGILCSGKDQSLIVVSMALLLQRLETAGPKNDGSMP